MLNVVLTKTGAMLAEGIPEIFLFNPDFCRLTQDQELVHRVRECIGHDVCIGCIGVPDIDGVYRESTIHIEDENFHEAGGLAFYEKIRQDT